MSRQITDSALLALATDIQQYLEGIFGPRQTKYTFVGYYFSDKNFPHTFLSGARAEFGICVPESLKNNQVQLALCLAHETLHSLAPNVKPKSATVFEEGLAQLSMLFVGKQLVDNKYLTNEELSRALNGNPDYASALNKVSILAKEDGFFDVLRNMRRGQPWGAIDFNALRSNFQSDDLLLSELSQPFHQSEN